MSKVRINDLARELEVKSKAILDTLPLVGVTEKKTHSSSLEEHEAEKVRVYIRSSAEGSSPAGKSSSRTLRGEEEIKTKIDLSNISRPGDVLRAITQKKEAAAPPAAARPAAPPVTHAPAEKPAVVAPPGWRRPACSRTCGDEAGSGVAGRFATSGSGCSCASSGRASSSIVAHQCAGDTPGATASGTGSSRGSDSGGFSECSASGLDCGASGCFFCSRASSAAHDRSANRAAAGVQGSAACGSAAGAARSPNRRRLAPGARTSCSWPAHLSAASADGGRGSRCAASAAASGRAQADASHAVGACGCASARSGAGASTSGDDTAGEPSGRARATARSALCPAWREGRPDEGLYAATAHGGVE
jgi:hypothetical protein